MLVVSASQVPEKESFPSLKLSQPKQVVCKGNIIAYCSSKEGKSTQEICGKGTARIKCPKCHISTEMERPLCLLFKLSRSFAELGSRTSHPETLACPAPQFPYCRESHNVIYIRLLFTSG